MRSAAAIFEDPEGARMTPFTNDIPFTNDDGLRDYRARELAPGPTWLDAVVIACLLTLVTILFTNCASTRVREYAST